MKFKPMLAAGIASLGVMSFASPALADGLYGDPAIKDDKPFRLNPYTLEPGCFVVGRGDDIDVDTHIDLKSLVDGDGFVKELHLTVDDDAPFSVDQVLVPSSYDGYAVYNTFDTGSVDDDADVDPNQTAVDLFAPNGDRIDKDSVIVCVSDHDTGYENEPYNQEAGGLVSAKNRPVIKPFISCLGVSAIEPLNTYKAGFGYTAKGYNMHDRAVMLKGIRDPNAVDFNYDGVPDAVWIKTREDGAYDARRVNDVDSFGEEFGKFPIADYGQTELFLLSGDPTAWTLSNHNYPDTLSNLITFTTQGDLPLKWTVRPSLGAPSTEHFVELTDDAVRAWEASWQAYYDGGPKPTMRLCPGTNSPAPDNIEVINLPQTAPPATPAAPATVITREVTTVNTVAGPTQYVQVGAKKAKSSKKASCMKKAKAKKSKAARKRAKAKCRRM